MLGLSRGTVTLLLVAVLAVAACGSSTPSPSASGRPSGSAAPSGPKASGSRPPGTGLITPAPSPVATPLSVGANAAGFWKLAARSLSKSGRLRVVMTGSGTRELRFEPAASGTIADGNLSSVCVANAAYNVQGMQHTSVPGKWSCGSGALQAGFRKSGQPLYAWNSKLPADARIKERIAVVGKGRWQWTYTATSAILHGGVKTTLLLDVATGRLLSGSRTDPSGTTRYTFSYTTIFAPIQLPS